MLKFVVTFSLLVLSALAAPQLQQQNAQAYSAQQQNAQAYSAQQYQQQGSSSQTTPIPIISFDDSQPGDGTFKYSYESGNGIKLEGSGFTKKAVLPKFDDKGLRVGDEEQDVLVQVGSYSYTAPDGQLITIKYIADENGFQPQGDHLPTPPSVPEAIVNSLNQQANQLGQQQQQQQPQFAQQRSNTGNNAAFAQQQPQQQQQQQFGSSPSGQNQFANSNFNRF